jgi:hypothetical protein
MNVGDVRRARRRPAYPRTLGAWSGRSLSETSATARRSLVAPCDRPAVHAATDAFVAKRKPAPTVSCEQSDRQLSAGASRQTARSSRLRLTRMPRALRGSLRRLQDARAGTDAGAWSARRCSDAALDACRGHASLAAAPFSRRRRAIVGSDWALLPASAFPRSGSAVALDAGICVWFVPWPTGRTCCSSTSTISASGS